MPKNTRYRFAFVIIFTAFVISRLFALLALHTEDELYAAFKRYPQPLPPVVCYPVMGVDDMDIFAALYAVIPSILVQPDTPCDTVLTR